MPSPRPRPEVHLQDPATRAQGQEEVIQAIQRAMHPVEAEDQETIQQEEESRQDEDPQETIHPTAIRDNLHHLLQVEHCLSSQEEPGQPGGHPGAPSGHQPLPQAQRPIDPWTPLDRSRKSLPQFKLPSNYKSRSILDTQQMLEDWYNKSTVAIATWRGDDQRYWLDQVLETARARHDQ